MAEDAEMPQCEMQHGKRALLIAPYTPDDPPLGVTSTTERVLISFLTGEGMSVDTLEGEDAVYSNFKDLVTKEKYELLVYLGHGMDDAWLGQIPAERVLLDVEDAALLSGSVVVAICCSSLNQLGSRAVISTAKGYIGFDSIALAPFMERFDRNYRADFIRTFIHPVVCLTSGLTTNLAVLQTRNLCEAFARFYEEREFDFSDWYALCMRYNKSHFSYVGSPLTKL